MKIIAALATTTLALGLTAAAPGDVTPGQWSAKVRITSVEGQGLPPGMADIFAAQGAMTHNFCLTAEEANNAPETLFKETNGECRYESFSMSNGRLAAKAVCANPGMGDMVMHMDGTYSAASYEATNRMEANGPFGPMTIIAKASGTRTGDC